MTSLEKHLLKKMREYPVDIEDCSPSLQISVFHEGALKAELQVGDEYRYYDLASLTKILFTVSTFMRYTDEKRMSVEDRIKKWVHWWPHRSTEIREVLSHHAGLPWWAPFYEMLDKKDSVVKKREDVRLFFEKLKLGSKKKAVYSDLDFILLGFVMEAVEEHSLLEIFENTLRPLGLESLHFCPGNKRVFKKSLYAPTEKCPWRKKVLQGEVHDDNTWAFGGVSTHAGLFGELKDVAGWGLYLRQALRHSMGSPLATQKTALLFCRRQFPAAVGDWGLGFMMRSSKDSTAGRYFSKRSVGHTGFTGTSLWYDPVKDLLITILSNRVHPTRDNQNFKSLRPALHDWTAEFLR